MWVAGAAWGWEFSRVCVSWALWGCLLSSRNEIFRKLVEICLIPYEPSLHVIKPRSGWSELGAHSLLGPVWTGPFLIVDPLWFVYGLLFWAWMAWRTVLHSGLHEEAANVIVCGLGLMSLVWGFVLCCLVRLQGIITGIASGKLKLLISIYLKTDIKLSISA